MLSDLVTKFHLALLCGFVASAELLVRFGPLSFSFILLLF